MINPFRRSAAAILSVMILLTAVAADVHPDVLEAQRLMVRQQYPQASAKARSVLQNDPRNIDAIYTLAAIEQTRILDYESYTIHGRQFQIFADSLMKSLESIQPTLRGADSLRCLFYRANILGGVGLMKAKSGSWFEGARIAMASQNLYRQVKRVDPDHLGADLGLGVFDYYFGTTMSKIPFVSGGGIENGIRRIDRSLGAPFPFNHAAKSSYCWILIDRKEFRKADSLARSALRETPGSTIFLRIRALIALWTGEYGTALVIGRKLMDASQARDPVNWSDLTMSHYVVASSHDKLGQGNEALAVAERGLRLQVPAAYSNMPHIKDHIKHLTAIRTKYAGKSGQ